MQERASVINKEKQHFNIVINIQGPSERTPTLNTLKMNRKNLTQAVGRIATADGYHFYTAEPREMAQMINTYPAMWLTPPEFSSMQGRKHGKVVYTVTLHAMDAGAKLPPEERESIWTRLEQDVVELFSSLSSEEFVVAVENLKIRHSSHTLTPHGEVAATATAEVVTFF